MIQVVMKHQPALRKGTKQIYSVTEPLINSLIERPLVVTCVLYPVPQTGRVLELEVLRDGIFHSVGSSFLTCHVEKYSRV